MTTTYAIAPNPEWYISLPTGLPATGGKIYSYLASNHSTPKSIYRTEDGATAWPNPIILDAGGVPAYMNVRYPLYFASDALYYLSITDSDDNVIFSIDNYPPNSGGITPIVPTVDIQNYINNAQLYFIYGAFNAATGNYGFYDLAASPLLLAPGPLYFTKNNTSALQDSIQFVGMAPGQSAVPGNPRYALQYSCPIPGVGETLKKNYYFYPSVYQFAGETVNFQFYGESNFANEITIGCTQNFGTGGSPSTPVVTLESSSTLTSAYTLYEVVLDVPSISAKDLGTNSDDYFSIDVNYPCNVPADIRIVSPCLRIGDTIIPLQESNINDDRIVAVTDEAPIPASVNFNDGNYSEIMLKGSQQRVYKSCAGKIDIRPTELVDATVELIADGTQIYSNDYYNLVMWLKQYGSNFPNWGYAPQAYTSVVASPLITVTSNLSGAATDPDAGTSGFTVAVTTPGVDPAGSVLPAPSVINLTSTYDLSAQNFLIQGTYNGSPQTETMAGPNNNTVNSTLTYDAVIAIIPGSTSEQQGNPTTISAGYPTANTAICNDVSYSVNAPLDQNGSITYAAGTKQVFTVSIPAWTVALEGKYFTIGAPATNYYRWAEASVDYYVWFSLNNRTADPNTVVSTLTGKKGIKVIFTGSETVAQGAALIANQLLFAAALLPETQGMFLRGWANGMGFDPNSGSRISIPGQGYQLGGATGDHVGTYQQNQNLTHNHSIETEFGGVFLVNDHNGGQGFPGGNDAYGASPSLSYSGGSQSNPNNITFVFTITF